MKNFIRKHAEVDALEIIASLCETFPGLVDGETEVNGSYLIQELTAHIEDSTIPDYLRGGK